MYPYRLLRELIRKNFQKLSNSSCTPKPSISSYISSNHPLMANNQRNLDYGLFYESGGRGRSGRGRGGRSSSSASTHIPDTEFPTPPASATSPSAAPPSQMSVEDFVALPGRERLIRLHPDCAGTDIWFGDSGTGITKAINQMLNGLLQHPYPTYNSMPLADQEMWFRQFAQQFRWDSHMTAEIRRRFDRKCARMYSWKLNEWKGKWNNNDVPRELVSNPGLWNGLCTYWNQDATKASSTTHSANRNSDRKGKGKATHNLGAVSKVTKAKQLFREDGVEPSALRLLEVTHTNKITKEIQDPVAREISNTVRKMGETYLLSQPVTEGTPPLNEVPIDKINEFVYECTPKSKGRVFGLPDDGSSSATSRFYGESPDLSARLAEANAEMAEMKTQMQRMEEAQEAERERTRKLEADNLAMQQRMEADQRAMQERMNDFIARFSSPP